MHGAHVFTEQPRVDCRARVERCVDPGLDHLRLAAGVGAGEAVDQPAGPRQPRGGGWCDVGPIALPVHPERQIERRAVCAASFVQHRHVVLQMRARPVPIVKAGFERLLAEVRIEIAAARPAHAGVTHFDFDARARRDRMPAMLARRIEVKAGGANHFGVDADLPAHRIGERGGGLGDIDHQRFAVPMQRTGPDREMIGIAADAAARAFGHRPRLAARAGHRHIDRAVILRRVPTAQLVIGREDAADKGDDREPVAPAIGSRGVAKGVDIPPGIAVRVDLYVEPRSLSRISTARPPLSAAIGTPAPGCVLPPAQ